MIECAQIAGIHDEIIASAVLLLIVLGS